MSLIQFQICTTNAGQYSYTRNENVFFVWLLDEYGKQHLIFNGVPKCPTIEQIQALEDGTVSKVDIEAALWVETLFNRFNFHDREIGQKVFTELAKRFSE